MQNELNTYVTNLKNRTDLESEFKRRNKDSSEIEIPGDATTPEILEKKYGAGNYTFVKSRNVFKCKYVKEGWKQFEDKVWSILYRMGFTTLNEGICKVALDEKCELTKQVDVFAISDNVVCIIECKDSIKEKKSIKDYLNEFAGIKSKSSDYILKIFAGKKVNLRWIFATSFTNYESGAEDLAKQHGIWLINNWDYYDKLIGVLGDAAKYQFLANLMKDRELSSEPSTVYALSGTMANLPYYLFSITPNELMKLSFVPHAGVDSDANYEMYQRLVKPGRVKEIQSYIKEADSNPNGVTVNGLFPTNIVVNFRTKKPIVFDQIKHDKEPKPGYLHLPNTYGSIIIIDGQHRLFSFAGLDEAKTETLPVIAFDNLEASQQADIFYHINGKQEKVSKNLINQILCIQDWKSKNDKDRFYALPFEIILEMNRDSDSVLHNKIKMEGGSLKGIVSMTYAEVSDYFSRLKFFSKDKFKRNSKASPHYALLYYKSIDDTLSQTKKLLNYYFTYFIEHSSKVKNDWSSGDKSYFDTNSVIVPLLMVLKEIINYVLSQDDLKDRIDIPLKDYIDRVYEFQRIMCNYFDRMNEDEFTQFKLSAGGKGYSFRRDSIIEAINNEKTDFMKERVAEIKKHREESVVPTSTDVRRYIGEFENKMKFVFTRVLMENYGSKWFRDGIPSKISKESSARNISDGIEGMNYLLKGSYIIDLKEIFYYKDNYSLLEWFVVPEVNQNIKKSERANWLVTLNTYRNDIMHNKIKDGSKDFIEREKFIKEKLEMISPLFNKYIESNNLESEWSDYDNLSYPTQND